MHRRIHTERHRSDRIGWLRAAVLGANDGIVSTASLLVGIAAAGSPRPALLIAGVAALVAGAMSMAAGEYVSVSSQADTEQRRPREGARGTGRARATRARGTGAASMSAAASTSTWPTKWRGS